MDEGIFATTGSEEKRSLGGRREGGQKGRLVVRNKLKMPRLLADAWKSSLPYLIGSHRHVTKMIMMILMIVLERREYPPICPIRSTYLTFIF
jgi:hypothetical protein